MGGQGRARQGAPLPRILVSARERREILSESVLSAPTLSVGASDIKINTTIGYNSSYCELLRPVPAWWVLSTAQMIYRCCHTCCVLGTDQSSPARLAVILVFWQHWDTTNLVS